MSDEIRFSQASELPPMAVSLSDTGFNRTGSWRYLRPVMQEKVAPCTTACPAGIDLPRVLRLMGEERWKEAYQVIREQNPLPGVCGRVCYHPCEQACSRRALDQPASIQALERFVADAVADLPLEIPRPPYRKERIAIVGSGPAGLSCAYFLARRGFGSTIFEAAPEPGGMLRRGIPRYRLPRPILDREIESIARLGVEFRLNCRVGKEISLPELQRQYQAVFLAAGTPRSRRLKVPGEAAPQVMSGLDFLEGVNAGQIPDLGPRVLVIGGGNTAIDAARAALRLGMRTTVAYRRSRLDMPAVPSEVEEAINEGVEFRFQVAPLNFESRSGGIAVQLTRVELGAADASGRPRPLAIPGTEFTVDTDSVLEAVGESSDLAALFSGLGRDRNEPGRSEREALQGLEQAGFLVGGDAASGPSSVIEAIASGKKAAWKIVRRLLREDEPDEPLRPSLPALSPGDLNLQHFPPTPRAPSPVRPIAERIADFDEVTGTLAARAAAAEARRCFSCGTCNQCDNCWIFCPEAAVSRSRGKYQIDLDYCKGCGICVQECPRGVISLIPEEQ